MKNFIAVIVSLLPALVLAADNPVNTTLTLPAALDNKEMRIIEIALEPGQASAPHRHNAHVYVYVLEGEIEMQVRGGPLTLLKAGDTFYENPEDIHQVSRNASNTEGARFLVHMLKSVGELVTVPVEE